VIARFVRACVDFVVGDDVWVAVGIAVAIALAALVARASDGGWWVLPVAVPLVVAVSLLRAARAGG
jgi:hypothetical protein